MKQPGKKENKENKVNKNKKDTNKGTGEQQMEAKTEKENKKDTNKSTGEQEMEANRTECSGVGHKHVLNKCPLGNVVNNTSLVTNRTPEIAPETQESMEVIEDATSKRKKNPNSENENSPDREAIKSTEKVIKLIKDTKEMKGVEEKEEGEIEIERQEEMEGIVEANNKRKKNPDSDNERSPDREATEAVEIVKRLIMDTKELNNGKDENEKEEGEIVQRDKQAKRNKYESSKMKLDKTLKDFGQTLESMQVENLKTKGHILQQMQVENLKTKEHILQQMETSKNEVMRHVTSEILKQDEKIEKITTDINVLNTEISRLTDEGITRLREITEISASLNNYQYNQEKLKDEVATLTRKTADDVMRKKIETEINKLPRLEEGIQQEILDQINRQAVKEDMRCLMVYNIDMSLRKKHPRMILEEFADRAGLSDLMNEAITGVENAQFGTNMRTNDSEAPKSTLYLNMYSDSCGWRLRKALIASKMRVTKDKNMDPMRNINVKYKLSSLNLARKKKLADYGAILVQKWASLLNEVIVEVDERSENLVLKIGLFEHLQNKLHIKRWATVQEPNFRQDLPELDQGSGISSK